VWVKLHDVPVMAFSEDCLNAIAMKLGTLLMLDSYTSHMYLQSRGWSSYARAMIKLRTDVELKDNTMVAMPKLIGEGFYTCNICVEYKWKPPRLACCKVFAHFQEECANNIGAGETKNLKKPSQTPRGVPVGQKVGFKQAKQVYQLVSKKPTANTSGPKKKNMEPTKEVSKTNPFDVLTSVENDVDLGDYDSEDKWKESYENDDYEYDPYDDDMYEGHEIPDKLQAICDNLHITVRVVERNSLLVLLFLL
ncbi:hypothetical protein Tco_0583120, partial [Tanacetum coccineum]